MSETRGVGVGIDTENVERFAMRLTDYTHGASRSLFAAREHEWCQAHRNPAAAYAMCWCSKEAAVKALWKWARLDPRRIEIDHSQSPAAPRIVVRDAPATLAGVDTRVSLSMTATTATAMVLAFEPERRLG